MNPVMQYPVFVTEQVLTAKNLNDIVEYLNEQDLSTRRNLIGVGIACGLNISSDLKSSVKISCGCGVTSLGLLLEIPELILKHYRKYKDDKAARPYDKFIKQGNQVPLWELLTQKEYDEANDTENDHPIKGNADFDLKDMAVLLYLEIVDKELDTCIDEGCDIKGKTRLFNLRKLLIKKSDLLKILIKPVTINVAIKKIVDDKFISKKTKPAYYLKSVKTHRLKLPISWLTPVLVSDYPGLNLSYIDTWGKLYDAYLNALKTDAIDIGKALFQSYELFENELKDLYSGGNPFKSYENPNAASNEFIKNLKTEIDKNHLNIQYAYDFLCDLTKAYDEFCETASEYQSRCCIDTKVFPYHLMLGVLKKPETKTDHIFRHHWQQSPAVSNMNDMLNKLRLLHYKMFQMIRNFNLPTFSKRDDIVITPGKFSGWPFSEHSMAHYYNQDSSSAMHKYWSYELVKRGMEDTVLSGFASQYSAVPSVISPLEYCLHNFEHFRVEGHIGQEYNTVLGKVRELITQFNLPFDVLGIKLSSEYLDVAIEDHCFNDIQTVYKCNRDEYVACVRALRNMIELFFNQIKNIAAKNPRFLQQEINEKKNLVPFISTINHVYQLLNIYPTFLARMEQELPENIKDFRLQPFRRVHFIVWAFTLICEIMLEYVANLVEQLFMPFAGITFIKTLFERLLDDCMEAKFKSLYEMYRERLVRMQLGRLFPGYVDGSPGIEHIGGVKEGGTFILVYDEMPSPEPIRPERPRPFVEEKDPCLENDETKELYKNVLFYGHMMATEPVLAYDLENSFDMSDIKTSLKAKRAAVSEIRAGTLTSENGREIGAAEEIRSDTAGMVTVNYVNKGMADMQNKFAGVEELLRSLFGQPEELDEIFIPRKTYRVVADFAVPYRCCSKCLQVDELPSEDITIDLQYKQFCISDTIEYPVILEPSGGELHSSAGGIIQKGKHYYFTPANVNWTEEDVVLTYTLDDKTVKLTVKVFNPLADFDVSPNVDANGMGQLLLTNKSLNADTFRWEIPEFRFRSTQKDPPPVQINEHFSEVTIILTALKGDCQNTKTIEHYQLPETDIRFELETPKESSGYVYCKNDNTRYYFTTEPAGEVIQEPGVEYDENAVSQTRAYYIIPANMDVREYTFNFRGRTIKASVIEVPEVDFTYENIAHDRPIVTVQFEYEPGSYASVQWNFHLSGPNDQNVYREISENPVTHDFNYREYILCRVGLLITYETGCQTECIKELDFSRFYHIDPDVLFQPDRFGNILLAELAENDLVERFPDYDYVAVERLMRDTGEIEAAVKENAVKKESLYDGKMNLDMANNYETALNETADAIMRAHENNDAEMTKFLTTMYLGQVQQLLSTISVLRRDPGKTSKLYKVLANTERQLATLDEHEIDINPDGNLEAMLDKSIPQLATHKNTTEVLTKLSALK